MVKSGDLHRFLNVPNRLLFTALNLCLMFSSFMILEDEVRYLFLVCAHFRTKKNKNKKQKLMFFLSTVMKMQVVELNLKNGDGECTKDIKKTARKT